MNLADDLLSAASWAQSQADVAVDPAFLRPHQALQAAAQGLARAWSGSWSPGLARLYDRQLRALPLSLRLPAGAAAAQPSPELLMRCKVWTPQQIRQVIRALAGQADTVALEAASARAAACLEDMRACFQASLWHMAGTRGRGSELAALAFAARHIKAPDTMAILETLRPAPATRRQASFGEARFEGPPPHLAELAALEGLLSPFQALRQFAKLMRCAAECVQVPPRQRPALTPHLLARRVENCRA